MFKGGEVIYVGGGSLPLLDFENGSNTKEPR
ncbi:hypothetical protein FB005_11129 [Sinorhizobium medicae]|nr:hypothetical protein FB006_11129 [Sinorhizobium medicae]TWA25693.1 hypothetical protein FB007_13511 [Sinorhizobium medicae]TWA41633.1 hypothetical protein FB005_11129 [Sinorhizobium medicae]